MSKKMTAKPPAKVLVVDDSPYCRKVMLEIIQAEPRFTVVGVAANGHEAMSMTMRMSPDLITLDLEMPVMDGLAFLRWAAVHRPTPVVVVTYRGDEATVMKALELGAVDVVVKPTRFASPRIRELRTQLLSRLEAAADASTQNLWKALALQKVVAAAPAEAISPRAPVRLVALGASTGGPSAIRAIVSRLPRDLPVPVVVSQHMPPGFTRHFAERLNSAVALRVREAAKEDVLRPGTVYVCPGDHHLGLVRSEDAGSPDPGSGPDVQLPTERVRVHLQKDEKEPHAPSVDIMMIAAARTYGAGTLGVLLTGMGRDGMEGLRAIKQAGGCTLAEAEESAVVFGMPRAAIQAGVVEHVLPLERMAGAILELVGRGEPRWG